MGKRGFILRGWFLPSISCNWALDYFGSKLFDLEVNITVATDSSMTNIIAESGSGWENYSQVDFDLASDETVYILVHENSVYGDLSGFYNIGVYDDAHLTSLTTTTAISTTWTGISPDSPFEFLNSLFLIFGIAVVSIFIIAIVGCILTRSQTQIGALQVIQAPQAAIPKKYYSKTETDDGLRMVRIPVECPKCNAPLSQESIDWVGPLEAKCNYCGSTVRVKFERV